MKPLYLKSAAALAASTCLAAALIAASEPEAQRAEAALAKGSGQLVSVERVHATIPNVPLATYAGLAKDLVLADVVASRVIDRPGEMLRTEYELAVIESYFGAVSGSVRVQVAGGVTETRQMSVDAAPHFELGARQLIFLGGDVADGALGVLGLSGGCYTVAADADGLHVKGRHADPARDLTEFVLAAQSARLSFLEQLEVIK